MKRKDIIKSIEYELLESKKIVVKNDIEFNRLDAAVKVLEKVLKLLKEKD